MEMVEVKVCDINFNALNYAYLRAAHGDGPDWRVSDGVFGAVYLVDVIVGLDGHGEQEMFQPFNPVDFYGPSTCRSLVRAKLGDVVTIPKELV